MTEFPGVPSGQSGVPPGPPGDAHPYPYPPGPYPPGAYGPPGYPGFPPVPPTSNNGLAVAALVIGIVALLTSPFLVGVVLGVAALAMGVAAHGRARRSEGANGGGMAVAGILLGILAIVIALICGALLAFVLGTDLFNNTYQHCLLEHNGMSQFCEQYR